MKTWLSHDGFLTHRNCEVINICYFKPLSFGVIYYVVINDTLVLEKEHKLDYGNTKIFLAIELKNKKNEIF